MGKRSTRRRNIVSDATGIEFVPDETGGVTIVIDGFPQSYVHPADPGLLPFEYVQHLAAIVDVLPIGKVTVTHIGGAGLSLARYVEFTRPGSPQIVFEPRADLTERVRAELPLPRGHRIRVRPVTGEEGIVDLGDGSADLVVVDAFSDGRLPAPLARITFWQQAARVAGEGGTVAVNIPDNPGLGYAARVVATARAAGLGHAVLIATHEVLRGRRFGNVVAAVSASPLPQDELARRVGRAAFPTGIRRESDTARLTATAAPIREDEDVPSPTPPTPGTWRAL